MLDTGWLNIGFIILTIVECLYFWYVSGKENRILLFVGLWLSLQAILASNGFYQVTDIMPPRLTLVFAPIIALVLALGLSKELRHLEQDSMFKNSITFIWFRIPVEVFFLYGLYQQGYIAQELTFEGNNWDIISGISMPLAALLLEIQSDR